ncbi:ferredoxin [Desulfococcaceae bacterium OttesenSCG-928-F15]|nr:ferredoxin [Desulfococcaceae bacterium OttesenSCG-928-F15]
MKGELELELDLGDCIRCGICVELCPAVFSWSPTGNFVQVDRQGECPFLEEAIRTCPADCIRLSED